MLVLVLGIIVFLGVHTLTTFRAARLGLIDRFGASSYKIGYSVTAAIGFVLIAWGFHRYRAAGMIPVWAPPPGLSHVTILLMWLAFISLAAMNPAPGRIRGWLRHPMLVAIKIWALAHLLVNGDAGGMLLFGAFLAWAVFDRIAVKRRGDAGAPRLGRWTRADALTVGIGTLAFVLMLFLHPVLIGVPVIGM